MFMPNDFGNGGGAPQQGSGGPFDLQAQLAQLPPQIRAQVMARMGMPGQGGMQAGMPDQGMNQTGPMPPQGGMRPGLPGQGSQGQMPPPGGGSSINPQTGQPWDRNIGPGMRQRILAQSQQPAPGSGPIAGGNPFGNSQAGPVTGQWNERGLGAQQGIYGGGPSGRAGELGLINSPITQQPVADMGDNRLNRGGKDPGSGNIFINRGYDPRNGPGGTGTVFYPPENGEQYRDMNGQMGGPKGPGSGTLTQLPGQGWPSAGDKGPLPPGSGQMLGDSGFGGGNTLHSMPAPVPNGNARPFRPQMSATDRAAAIAADRQMVGGAPPYVGKPKPMTDPPQTEPPVTGTATDVKPVVGKPKPMPPTPSPQQDPLQGATKPKPKPKPTLGRNYGPK